MNKLLAIAALVPTLALASPKESAVAGQWADVGTTAVGLALGAAEANPLGILALPIKAWVADSIDDMPAERQPAAWASFGAFGWGAAANNLCVIGMILSGGSSAALCPLLGVGTGVWYWQQHKPAEAN